MNKRNGGSNGFSLIEILVVIVIIGVLFAVALAVFENAGRKNAQQAAEQLIGSMRLARQHAVTARQWTFVVFPNRDGGAYADEDVGKCLRGYAVLAVQNNMDGLAPAAQIPSNMDLAFVADWKTLPEGVYFNDDAALSGNVAFGALHGGQSTYAGVFQFPLDPANPNLRVRPMGAVLFRPNGRAYVMHDGNPNGNFWQDVEGSKIYVTSEKHYDQAGGTLTGPTPIPGTKAAVQIGNKTGQVKLWTP